MLTPFDSTMSCFSLHIRRSFQAIFRCCSFSSPLRQYCHHIMPTGCDAITLISPLYASSSLIYRLFRRRFRCLLSYYFLRYCFRLFRHLHAIIFFADAAFAIDFLRFLRSSSPRFFLSRLQILRFRHLAFSHMMATAGFATLMLPMPHFA